LDTFGKNSYPIETFLPSSSLEGLSSLILYPLFATGVIDTGGKFAAGVVVTSGNLPPVSLIPAAILSPVSLTPVANLPLVSLIPVVHLYLQIFPRIFEKIRNGPNGILWGWEETDS
jgi:hypothetical protein